jgi:hypothetical protein
MITKLLVKMGSYKQNYEMSHHKPFTIERFIGELHRQLKD